MDKKVTRKNMRKTWITSVVALCVVVNVLTGCQVSPKMKRYEVQYFDVFDTITTIIAYAESEEEFNRQADVIYSELKTYHKLYDIYHDYDGVNNIKTINDNAGIKPVKVDKKIIELLKLAKDMYEKTDGKINVAYGSVLSIWHQYRTKGLDNPDEAKLPDMEELKLAAAYTDINCLQIDEIHSTVYLEEENMLLDVGAIGKGYAAQMAAQAGRDVGMTSFLINVGGNIVTEGTRADGSAWTLGIQNPDTESKEAYVLKIALKGETLVTSGNYQRYYVVNGKEYHHIINPETMFPAEFFASVSVITKNSGMADALSTAVYNMPLEEGKALLEEMEDTEAMWILEDDTKVYTDGFERYIVK